jgi:hypothetical protein
MVYDNLKLVTAAGNRRMKFLLSEGEQFVGCQGTYIGLLEYYVARMALDNPDVFQELIEELDNNVSA